MPVGRRLRLPVAVTILTGALAAGKTTAIAQLLQKKPRNELWAVLVNEFGAAGLDAALLEGSATEAEGVHIQQLAGGCLCCALANVTQLAIAQLLRRIKPDRLIIEPSGLAHPAALLDMLQGEHLGSSLKLQPVVCLVDMTQFAGSATPPCCSSQLLADQISVADVLVGSKADLVDDAAVQAFQQWASQLYPAKLLVTTAEHGRLDDTAVTVLLGLSGPGGNSSWSQPPGGEEGGGTQQKSKAAQQSPGGSSWLSSDASGAVDAAPSSLQTHQRRQVHEADGSHVACGWIFSRECRFHRPRLLALLHVLVARCLRVKGVFRVGTTRWEAVSAAPAAAAQNAAAADVGLVETAYRRDSRLEVIIPTQQQQQQQDASNSLAPAEGGNGSALVLEQHAGQLCLNDSTADSLEQDVSKALSAASAGSWELLEALVLATLEAPVLV